MDTAVAALVRAAETARKRESEHKQRFSDDPAVREAFLARRRQYDKKRWEKVKSDPDLLEKKRSYFREYFHRAKAKKAAARACLAPASPNEIMVSESAARAANETESAQTNEVSYSEALATDI